MGERDDARRSIEAARERMTDIAEELSRRASADYFAERVKERAVKKGHELKGRSYELKDRAKASPTALAVIGGVGGAVLGSILGKRGREHRLEGRYYGHEETKLRGGTFYSGYEPTTFGTEDEARRSVGVGPEGYRAAGYGVVGEGYVAEGGERLGYGGGYVEGSYEEEGGGAKEKLAGKAQGIKESISEKAHEVKESIAGAKGAISEKTHAAKGTISEKASMVRERAHGYRERLPSAGEVKGKASDLFDRNPWLFGLGVAAIGAGIAWMLPLSESERRSLAPLKDRARRQLDSRFEQVKGKVAEAKGKLEERSGISLSQEKPVESGISFSSPKQPEVSYGTVGGGGIQPGSSPEPIATGEGKDFSQPSFQGSREGQPSFWQDTSKASFQGRPGAYASGIDESGVSRSASMPGLHEEEEREKGVSGGESTTGTAWGKSAREEEEENR